MRRIEKSIINKMKKFRKKGCSIPEISYMCNVAKSTVLRYIKNVKILPQYYQRWEKRRNASRIISERQWKIASKNAQQIMQSIKKKDLILIGVVLYWAEGTKKDFSFCNTDPKMIKIFVYVLKRIFKIHNHDLKISIRIYEDLNKVACINYWSKIIGFKLNKVNVNVLSGSKKGKLKYGMCRIRVKKGGLLLKKFWTIIDRINNLVCPCSSMDRTSAS